MADLRGEPAHCTWELDRGLKLVAVDDAWTAFALANDAPELVPPGPIGKSVLTFISDPTTALVYEELFRRIRQSSRTAHFAIRCDSATARRWLDLTVTPHTGGFHLRSDLVRRESRASVAVLEPHAETDSTLLRMCSWCKKTDVSGAWLEIEDAVEVLRLFERPVLPLITHSMCEMCYDHMDEVLATV